MPTTTPEHDARVAMMKCSPCRPGSNNSSWVTLTGRPGRTTVRKKTLTGEIWNPAPLKRSLYKILKKRHLQN